MIFDLLFTATSFLSTLTSQLDAVTAREIRARGDRHTDVHISREKVVACPHRVSCREKKSGSCTKRQTCFSFDLSNRFLRAFLGPPGLREQKIVHSCCITAAADDPSGTKI
jgi:hypothetical protein